jgi:hypothetical protein
MSEAVGWVRRQLPGIVALVLVTGLFLVARLLRRRWRARRGTGRSRWSPAACR